MTDPLPPALAALPRASQPAAESVFGAGRGRNDRQLATAMVLTLTRQGPLIESAGNRWLVSGAPPLSQGARLTLEHLGTGAPQQSARLLAIDARALAPPLAVRLQPVMPQPAEPTPAEGAPHGAGAVPVEARLIGPAGRPLGPAIASSLSVARPDAPPAQDLARPAIGGSSGARVAPFRAGPRAAHRHERFRSRGRPAGRGGQRLPADRCNRERPGRVGAPRGATDRRRAGAAAGRRARAAGPGQRQPEVAGGGRRP